MLTISTLRLTCWTEFESLHCLIHNDTESHQLLSCHTAQLNIAERQCTQCDAALVTLRNTCHTAQLNAAACHTAAAIVQHLVSPLPSLPVHIYAMKD